MLAGDEYGHDVFGQVNSAGKCSGANTLSASPNPSTGFAHSDILDMLAARMRQRIIDAITEVLGRPDAGREVRDGDDDEQPDHEREHRQTPRTLGGFAILAVDGREVAL